MGKKTIDYEAAFYDLSERLDKVSRECAEACRSKRETIPFAKAFEELEGFGDAILVKHIQR